MVPLEKMKYKIKRNISVHCSRNLQFALLKDDLLDLIINFKHTWFDSCGCNALFKRFLNILSLLGRRSSMLTRTAWSGPVIRYLNHFWSIGAVNWYNLIVKLFHVKEDSSVAPWQWSSKMSCQWEPRPAYPKSELEFLRSMASLKQNKTKPRAIGKGTRNSYIPRNILRQI